MSKLTDSLKSLDIVESTDLQILSSNTGTDMGESTEERCHIMLLLITHRK